MLRPRGEFWFLLVGFPLSGLWEQVLDAVAERKNTIVGFGVS